MSRVPCLLEACLAITLSCSLFPCYVMVRTVVSAVGYAGAIWVFLGGCHAGQGIHIVPHADEEPRPVGTANNPVKGSCFSN